MSDINDCIQAQAVHVMGIVHDTVGLHSPTQIEGMKDFIKAMCAGADPTTIETALRAAYLSVFGTPL